MSRSACTSDPFKMGFPRPRGDEPAGMSFTSILAAFSPPARG